MMGSVCPCSDLRRAASTADPGFVLFVLQSDAHALRRPQLCIDLRPASQGARFPAPTPAKAGTMPAHKCLGPDDRNSVEDSRKPTIELDEEQAIAIGKVNTTAHLALQHDQLMSKRGILCFKPALRLEERGNHVQQEGDQRDHSR
jgi:hypothetical protein